MDLNAKKKWLLGICMCVSFLTGLAAGWYAYGNQEPRIEYREKVVEKVVVEERVVKESETEKESTNTTRTEETKNENVVVKWRTKTVYIERPDGTKEKVEETEYRSDANADSHSSTDSDFKESSKEKSKEESERVVEVEVEKLVYIEKAPVLPQWRIQVSGGGALSPVPAPVFGIGVERRIVGPIWLGVRGQSTVEAALTVSVEF